MHARIAAFLAALLLMPLAPLALAQESSSMVAPSPPVRQSVWTVMNTIEAAVRDNYATIRVIADIANRGPDPEFPFRVEIPGDAFVTGLTITRDGTTYEARIADRAEARQEYEEHKRAEQTGGLVERQRGSQVYAFLINVAEFTNVRAVLTYERYLAADQGQYNLPLEAPVSGFGRDLGARFEVTVSHADGVLGLSAPAGQVNHNATSWSLSHQVGSRPNDEPTRLNVSYTLKPTADGGSLVALVRDGKGFFAHRFRAPADARELPLDLVLVLDTSGSMAGLKMSQMQDAAAQVVGMLRPEDRLHLVLFSSDATSSWSGLRNATAEQRRLAADDIRSAFAAGGTNIEAGVRDGFAAFDGIDWAREEGRMPILVFLTDGQPTSGVTEHGALREVAREANAHGVSVFALAFGGDADWKLVSGLAADGNGVALRVPEGAGAEVDLRQFMAALTTPVLKDVVVTYDDGVTAERRSAPILFAGSEMLLVGTFRADLARLSGTVKGMAPDGPRTYRFSEAVGDAARAAFLPRLVASEQIRHLQDLIAAEGPKAAWEEAIRELALKHGFVTDYTSLVLTLDPRDPNPCMELCIMEDRSVEGASAAPSASGPMASTGGSGGSPATVGKKATSPSPPSAPGGGPPTFEQIARGEAAKTPGFEAFLGLAALAAVALLLARRRNL